MTIEKNEKDGLSHLELIVFFSKKIYKSLFIMINFSYMKLKYLKQIISTRKASQQKIVD